MKILILGAGQVGSSMAWSLTREENDITVVDIDRQRLAELQDKLDIRTVEGNGAHPRVLTRAGAEDTDLLVALTSSDEINMVACQVAYSIFNIPTKIARVRASEYLNYPQLFSGDHCPVDVLISPEKLVTEHVQRLIEFPGALQVLDFADGKAQVVALRATRGGPLPGRIVADLKDLLPKDVEIRVAAIFRGETAIVPDGDTRFNNDDLVFMLAERDHIRTVMAELRRFEKPARRIILAGGGNIGLRLARALENRYNVKIIERYRDRAELLSVKLDSTITLVGDCADEDLLREENIDQTDVYCALTNDDEANILSSMLAKKLGAHKVITLINRPAYADLVEAGTIDIAISPQQVTIGALLTHVRRGDMVRVHALRRGAAEAIEAVAHGDARNSRVVGRSVEELDLPDGTSLAGVVRGDTVLIPHHNLRIEAEDHVILLVTDKKEIQQVERLFQVAATFV